MSCIQESGYCIKDCASCRLRLSEGLTPAMPPNKKYKVKFLIKSIKKGKPSQANEVTDERS